VTAPANPPRGGDEVVRAPGLATASGEERPMLAAVAAQSGAPDLDARGHHRVALVGSRMANASRSAKAPGRVRTGRDRRGPEPRPELETAVPGGRSPRWELNPRPTPYQGVALPLSYLGPRRAMVPTDLWTASRGL
jgi:hypothetical protein